LLRVIFFQACESRREAGANFILFQGHPLAFGLFQIPCREYFHWRSRRTRDKIGSGQTRLQEKDFRLVSYSDTLSSSLSLSSLLRTSALRLVISGILRKVIQERFVFRRTTQPSSFRHKLFVNICSFLLVHARRVSAGELDIERVCCRPFPYFTSVRSNNSTRARLGWTFSYNCCIFVHPDLDSVLLFAGMRERSIVLFSIHSYTDKNNLL